jgi:hypothetical protein
MSEAKSGTFQPAAPMSVVAKSCHYLLTDPRHLDIVEAFLGHAY